MRKFNLFLGIIACYGMIDLNSCAKTEVEEEDTPDN